MTERPAASVSRLAKFPVAFAVPAALLFGAAGTLAWPAAWVYLAFLFGGGTLAIVLFNRLHPGLLEERKSGWRRAKSWDKPLYLIIGVLGPMAVQLVCGLDKRFGWSPPVSTIVPVAAGIVFALGTVLVAWAITANPFFSSVVRIQTERGHSVASGGPYALVRHPSYTGMIVTTLATPVLLGSRWGFVPAALLGATVLLRTVGEDRVLHAELPGYAEYAARVRFRLVPGVW